MITLFFICLLLLCFLCWCIVHVQTSYDREISDKEQLDLIKNHPS